MRTKILATLDALDGALEFIRNEAQTVISSPEHLSQVELACEEALVNIIRHGYRNTPGPIEIECKKEPAHACEISISDWSEAYNPLAAPYEEGHRGIALMKSLVDKIEYTRDGSKNILTLHKEA
jgi:anti-sigma regulatory factor (Ser/Thr protein kinase)